MIVSRYARLLLALLRNSLVREMAFRGNFLIEVFTRGFWFAAQIVMFSLIYGNVTEINGWTRHQFFVFMATGMIINTLVEAFFMPNCTEFSELIRNGNLDFVLLKPVDPQFLVSLEKVNVGTLSHLLLSGGLLCYGLSGLSTVPNWQAILGYLLLIPLSVAFLYSLMLSMAATSVWFGRNQGLYEFWFYITIFSRYPRDIYAGSFAADVLSMAFSFLLPILLVVTVPAEVLTQKLLNPSWVWLVLIAGSFAGLFVSRQIFLFSLRFYRSASS